MLKDADSKTLDFMVTATCFSPLLYGLIALILDGRGTVSPHLSVIYRVLIVISFILVLISRPVERALIPGNAKKGELEDSRIALAGVLIAGISEMICFLGVGAIIVGANINAFIPFFILSALSFADFRIFRFPALLDLMMNDGTTDPDD